MSTETKTAAAATPGDTATDAAGEKSVDTSVDTSVDAKEVAEAEPDAADAAHAADGAVPSDEPETDLDDDSTDPAPQDPSYGVGQGAAAVVAAGLGVVSLTGSWVGTVAAARSNLVGQLETARTAGVADQIQALYGDQWHLTALIGGAFALLAVVIGVGVLARPAFGRPGRVQAPWIKSVAWAGVGLGVVGLLLAVAKYTDLILGLPSAP
ncbi:hypothetical protein QIS99_07895 [Streptomyces sp. B-S-A8]|uniref:Integral membrane protein n=1 Tax=Streptomyces solicavernae TaxID=3043614 RepID=A0ABT6RPK0_9ACTN|nr:hypothetical protein [Streptomyces sp. B-S-A8]MDI3386139.1 hypothetical protein [Streptomyces sp. B-S-A8]